MEISRRFFLGGAISLAAAVTFKPSVAMMANIPTIYGDGEQDDAPGLGALFRNDPVTFNKEQIGIESHNGISFHKGTFLIKKTVEIPKGIDITVEGYTIFDGDQIEQLPFFRSYSPVCFLNYDKGIRSMFILPTLDAEKDNLYLIEYVNVKSQSPYKRRLYLDGEY